jgi:diacylglycerol kinase (ATP)
MVEPISPTPSHEERRIADLERARRRGFIGSVVYATDGLMRTLSSQRNMKIHWVSGLAVMLVGMALELNISTRASVIFCVFVVLCMEVLNTALEAFVDLHVKQYARQAMVAKDAAAAAVLVLAGGAVVVFADVLFHQWSMVMRSGPEIVRTVLLGVPLLAVTGTILGIKRSMPVIWILGVAALTLLSILAYSSRDEVFSSCGLVFVVGAVAARYREPKLQ